MRRIKCLVGAIVITVAVAIWAQAQDFICYTNNGAVVIMYYTGSGSDVTIPDEIGGVPVTRIEQFAFWSATNMTNLTLGKNITNLAVTAFDLCNSLRTITVDALNPVYSSVAGVLFDISQTTLVRYPSGKAGAYAIPDTVTRVGGYAFSGCIGLMGITIPNGVTNFEDFAFYACPNLTSVTIPNTIINLGDHTFHSCTGLTNVIFPANLTRIGVFTFCFCNNLKGLIIPDAVTNIGTGAFAGCLSLPSVRIPSSVTSIGVLAFDSCASLASITVDANNPVYSSISGVLFNKSQTTLIEYPAGVFGPYTIPSTVTRIFDAAFNSCARLTSVMIPSSVTNIGSGTFQNCGGLIGVYFRGNAPTIGSGFISDKATVYYLPGTAGWGPTFAGRPTALWVLPKPLILYNGPSSGAQTNGFGFMISWATNLPVVVEASSNLSTPIWSPISTNTFTNGSSYFSDVQWTNNSTRFYRIRSPTSP